MGFYSQTSIVSEESNYSIMTSTLRPLILPRSFSENERKLNPKENYKCHKDTACLKRLVYKAKVQQ